MSAHTVAGLLQSQTPVPGKGGAEKVCRGFPAGHPVHPHAGGTETLKAALLGETPKVLWHEKKQHDCIHFTLPKQWGRPGGTDKLKTDSILGPLSITRVYGLFARNKHFLITDST